MGNPADHSAFGSDTHGLAVSLVPVLRELSGGRLGPIEWFRAAWQHSGSETAFSTWKLDDGTSTGVVVKLPVGFNEYKWTRALGTCDLCSWHDPCEHARASPRVIASGLELGGYDLAWLVIERLPGLPVSTKLSEQTILDLLHTAADFQAAASDALPLTEQPPSPDWEKLIAKALETCRDQALPEWAQWREVVKRVHKSLPALKARWASRAINCWCHGDLHPGNAMRRAVGDPDLSGRAGCTLIDLALVHTGHWVEDALYLERQFWGHEDRLYGVKPVTALAQFRRNRGLSTNDGYAEVAMVRRVLMAACAPAHLEREGNQKYVRAALETLEKTLPQVLK